MDASSPRTVRADDTSPDTPLFAAIDVGSHSVKLRVAARDPVRRWRTVADAVQITGLGRGEPRRDGLDPTAQDATLAALARFARQLQTVPVAGVAAVGTAVLREAADVDRFVARVRRETGLPLEVIAGEEEARLTYLGAHDAIMDPAGREPREPRPALVACDIGGRSTELAWGRGPRPHDRRSLELGTITLTTRFGLDGAVGPAVVDAATAHAAAVLRQLPALPAGAVLVGIGATPASLEALRRGEAVADGEQVHGARLTLDDIAAQVRRLRSLAAADRRTLAGLHPGRAAVILAGAVLCAAVVAHAGADPLVVSAHGLRRGLLVHRFGAA